MVLGQKWSFFHLLFFRQFRPGECVSSVGEHISLGICVFLREGTHISKDMCFLGGGAHITWDMCFPNGGTHITICFPAGGTLITRDMCFLGRGTHITTECVSLLGKHIASRKVKKLRFSQSGYGPRFWSKNSHFSTFVFRQCRPGKCVL